jgi:hypothetical protein
MPGYTIYIHRGPDTASHRVSLPDVDEARREASAVFADLARDIVGNLPDQPDLLSIEVTEAGRTVFKIGILIEEAGTSLYRDKNNSKGRRARRRTATEKAAGSMSGGPPGSK